MSDRRLGRTHLSDDLYRALGGCGPSLVQAEDHGGHGLVSRGRCIDKYNLLIASYHPTGLCNVDRC